MTQTAHQLSSVDSPSPVEKAREHLSQHLRGKREIIEFSLAAFLAKGHLLLEGPPGTGKTSLAKAMAAYFGGSFRRIQMTSDLLPSDIVGVLRLKPGQSDFEFRKGPLFSNFVLADELNRSSPKTQSALLEAMAEDTVTVDGVTHPLPHPFFVVATQNPLEFQGVYPLAESQLDRFMMHLLLSSPAVDDEMGIYESLLKKDAQEPGADAAADALSLEETERLRGEAAKVHIEPSVLRYATEIVRSTRTRPEVIHGVSVRGGLQFISAAKGLSFVRGRTFVTPAEIRELAVPVLAHRLLISGSDGDLEEKQAIIRRILDSIPAPR